MPSTSARYGDNKNFACPDCDKTFSRREYVNRHARLAHEGARPFLCDACDTSFARSDILKRHKTTCTVIKQLEHGADPNDLSEGGDGAAVDPTPPPKKRARRQLNKSVLQSTHNAHKSTANSSSERPVMSTSGSPIETPSPITVAVTAPALTRHVDLAGIIKYTGDVAFAGYAPPSVSTSSCSSSLSTTATPFGMSSSDLSPLSSCGTSSGSSATSPQTPSMSTPASSSSSFTQPHVHIPLFGPPQPTAAMAASALSSMYLNPTQSASANQTLAPGFFRASPFTQDEILASEVLEDLLRSPPPHHGTSPGGYFSQPIDFIQQSKSCAESQQQPLATALVTTPSWLGDKSMTTTESAEANDSSGALVGGIGWEYGGVPIDPLNSIEFSPEAQGLADYFNKGGVGGISALDLGFYHEPGLWDLAKMEQPVPHADRDLQFYVPAHKFCLVYLQPWNVPPIARLSQFAAKAADEFLPTVPVLHAGTTKLSEAPVAVTFALTVVGAAYASDGQGFSNEMLVEKRTFIVRSFNKADATEESRFTFLQSLLLYQLLGLFHRDQEQRLLANTFHSALILMVRELNLPTHIRRTVLPLVSATAMGHELDEAWKTWVELETRRRVTFSCFLCDLETATSFSCAPLLPFSELDSNLPSRDKIWNAQNAIAWRDAQQEPAPTINFLQAIRALIAPSEPSPCSPEGRLLADLKHLSSFPLLILSRTLSFLQHKTEEAMKQVDPFRSLISGFGLLDDRESANRDVLARIARGRAWLRSLPGGVKRGGGEGWFEDVMPTSAKSATRREETAAAMKNNQPSIFDDIDSIDHTALFTDYASNPRFTATASAANASLRLEPIPLYLKDEACKTKIEKLTTKRAKALAADLPPGWMPNF
ncbi:BQ5605_C005g03600 [Microbotryum silenes-dioicae]|uniref:BQ5605_C005g03600 protein n=1 Tax=Microbotryum silenes-dioicae TaxID=796604 RepID=A0A2X0MFS5_9BASI|nr:BQ5605_C005g03600 [Microbotryum silenes-dioicae]